MVNAPLPPASHHPPARRPEKELSPLLRYACAHLGHPALLSPCSSIACAHLKQKHPGWHTLASRPMHIRFTLSSEDPAKSKPLTPFFSKPALHFSRIRPGKGRLFAFTGERPLSSLFFSLVVNPESLTPSFSIARFHSLSLFFILAQISP